MKLIKVSAVLLLVFTVILVTACESSEKSDEVNSKHKGSDIKMANDNSEINADDSINFGSYCADMCQESLTLQAPRESIEGKVGLIVSGFFPYGLGTRIMGAEAARKYFPNMELIIGNGDNDPEIQSSIVDDFIAKKVDVIVIDLVRKNAVNPALERAKAAGIPIITIDRWTPAEVLTLIKADDVEVGRKAGQHIVSLLEGKGKVIEIKGSEDSTTTIDRHKGILESFKGYNDIQIIESVNADFSEGKAQQKMGDILQRLPKGKIDAVVSHADVMTMGAIKAIKAAGRENEIVVVSVDGQKSALKAIEAGDIDATVAYPIVMPMGIVAAAKTLAGEPIPEYIELEAPLITKENVAFYKDKTGY
ncbi:substrate-binding domain-containing protein [uncultured Metabacillus sp.]|uniref:substrate-binding domain-containing protein n=1 Tax=uncultured Metabacillus sp. TaxID=2860135 RepID=UPI00260B02DB|nr:substrate-binding domain-containing protein [uncultured Metabacillus sp.]